MTRGALALHGGGLGWILAYLLAGCAPHGVRELPAGPPRPAALFDAWEADALERVPDPARGGPPFTPSASPLPPFLGVDRATARYVGVAACAACHPAEAEGWGHSAHAHSLSTLERGQRAHDPRCLRCHVTGLGHPTGWTAGDAEPRLAAVGCEACHGPGSAHASAPADDPTYGRLPEDASACVACHTWDTSPDFDWGVRWALVAHGARP